MQTCFASRAAHAHQVALIAWEQVTTLIHGMLWFSQFAIGVASKVNRYYPRVYYQPATGGTQFTHHHAALQSL